MYPTGALIVPAGALRVGATGVGDGDFGGGNAGEDVVGAAVVGATDGVVPGPTVAAGGFGVGPATQRVRHSPIGMFGSAQSIAVAAGAPAWIPAAPPREHPPSNAAPATTAAKTTALAVRTVIHPPESAAGVIMPKLAHTRHTARSVSADHAPLS
ncbi:hypothetical protein [Streptodolium elevatio]|uniref:Uncharacterized protein n=1 Tax=Streptodolium elevatio TaxID=3157996 RepID=A0ABV3DSA3_9ACTN